ncbi:RNA polymerase II C-terminal domain phosphatase-like 4 [Ricinus communis]|uniref:RNA polymerase II C-terminal domain phosphatase-like n=1 Tax=Ricinus communis TaxID=3988 RepID=B9SJP1_RICCO|nr:RNA polymerase II C-terminal domain phosphatase-like 4 [Ricinus communis]XP_025014383.1 RNA polymerase II C-terminal domain phosphatase-like 4 [Ricinus communis]EEF36151.1 RNA polymerase II ctd phosphatase, putative [Ricinus communis]|eukprot:XP_002526210.1 RNA polymerase II C-terminal domain phosphatase-like 4 [Ricinus communis]
MSLVTDSPLHSSHSSSSDDFAALLDAELDSKSSSSDSSPKAIKHDDASDANDDVNEEEEEEESDSDDDSDIATNRIKRSRVETLENGENPKESTRVSLDQTLVASSSKVACTHPGSFGDMCILCGERLIEETGVTFGYIHKGLRLANDEIVRLRNTDMKNLLRHRKLYLVLDLDHTLLNSTQLMHLTAEEEYLKSQIDSMQDVSNGSLFMVDFMHMMTKLRPFIRTFLKEASQMFEMYIYTMGDRAYALEMAKFLDPGREYFNARVISRDDGTQRHQKGLDIVLGQESAVLILDDTENAWTKHKDNLILMERYHFFASSCRQFGFECKSLSQLKSDENESDGALASVLKVLRRIHHIFFDELEDAIDGRDVRQVLSTVRKDVLKGCKIVFSRVFPTQFQADNHHLWKMAEQLGATCSREVDPSVTHVVSAEAGTEKSRWALKNDKFLVHPRWIEATNYMWQRQPEENFSVNQPKINSQ